MKIHNIIFITVMMFTAIILTATETYQEVWGRFPNICFQNDKIPIIFYEKYIIKPDIFLSTEQQNTAHFELNRVFVPCVMNP